MPFQTDFRTITNLDQVAVNYLPPKVEYKMPTLRLGHRGGQANLGKQAAAAIWHRLMQTICLALVR